MSHKNYTRMGSYRKWFKTIRRKLGRSSDRDIIVVYTNTSPSTHEESARYQDLNGSGSSSPSSTEIFIPRRYCSHQAPSIFQGPPCQASISSTEEPGEATSLGSWGVCAETSTYGSALHACACPVADQGLCKAAPQRV